MWAAVEQTLPQKQTKHCGNSGTVNDMCVSHYTQTGRDHNWHTRTQLWLAAAQGQLSTTQTESCQDLFRSRDSFWTRKKLLQIGIYIGDCVVKL